MNLAFKDGSVNLRNDSDEESPELKIERFNLAKSGGKISNLNKIKNMRSNTMVMSPAHPSVRNFFATSKNELKNNLKYNS